MTLGRKRWQTRGGSRCELFTQTLVKTLLSNSLLNSFKRKCKFANSCTSGQRTLQFHVSFYSNHPPRHPYLLLSMQMVSCRIPKSVQESIGDKLAHPCQQWHSLHSCHPCHPCHPYQWHSSPYFVLWLWRAGMEVAARRAAAAASSS